MRNREAFSLSEMSPAAMVQKGQGLPALQSRGQPPKAQVGARLVFPLHREWLGPEVSPGARLKAEAGDSETLVDPLVNWLRVRLSKGSGHDHLSHATHAELMVANFCTGSPWPVRPNHSLKLTRYGSRRLAAPGAGGIIPFAAKRRLPSRAA